MTIAPDTLLNNRYRVQSTIAKGGMGAVYLAYDETLHVQVALKENLVETKDSTRQFRREATILAKVRHPNLPRVTDHFTVPDQGQYLVMDYIPGLDLKQRVEREGIISEGEALLIGCTVCDALSYLHNSDPAIVHRDIKPGNIKLTPTGEVVLVDFGLAKITTTGPTTQGAQALTPGFAPPEQYAQGTDPRSDIYALGATLYAALTNTIPEDGLERLLHDHAIPMVHELNPAVSKETSAVIQKAMSPRREERYQTAIEFKRALETANPTLKQWTALSGFQWNKAAASVDKQPSQSPPPQISIPNIQVPGANQSTIASPRTVPPPPVSPHTTSPVYTTPSIPVPQPRKFPWLAIGIPIILILGVIFLIILILPGLLKNTVKNTPTISPSPRAVLVEASSTVTITETAEAPLIEMTVTPESTFTVTPINTETITPTPLAAANGKWIAFVSERTGIPQIWLMQTDGSNQHPLTNLPDGACQPAWSPDGKQLVFVSPCPAKGQRGSDQIEGAILIIINADGTGYRPLKSLPGGDFDPAWSPNGTQIIFTSLRDGDRMHMYIYTLADDKAVRFSRPSSSDRHPAWSPDGKQVAFESASMGVMQIWLMSVDGKTLTAFSDQDDNPDTLPAWSPDGNILYYIQNAPGDPRAIARQVGVPGAKEVRIAERTVKPLTLHVSPDGSTLLFESKQDGNLEIYQITSNGANLTRLTNDPAADYQAVYQP